MISESGKHERKNAPMDERPRHSDNAGYVFFEVRIQDVLVRESIPWWRSTRMISHERYKASLHRNSKRTTFQKINVSAFQYQ